MHGIAASLAVHVEWVRSISYLKFLRLRLCNDKLCVHLSKTGVKSQFLPPASEG